MTEEFLPLCECGCGEKVSKVGNRFIRHHQNRGRVHTEEEKLNMSKIRSGKNKPLPNGFSVSKFLSVDKNSTQYLGIVVAERLLAKVFKDVQVMPYANHGYDFICGRGYKIDVKSSATGDRDNGWKFLIKQNEIPDYFLLIAFGSRYNLDPLYLWLIPGGVLNNLKSLALRKSTIHKWAKYEQPIDNVILCCDKMKLQ